MTSNRNESSIDLTPLLQGLEQPLKLLSEPEARERMQAYIDAARPQVERGAFDVLSGLVAMFNEASAYQRASLEYAQGGLRLRVEDAREGETEAAFSDGDLERVTIRLPGELKELIDTAAERHGISANTWYVRALSRAIARHMRDLVPQEDNEGRRGRRSRGHYRGHGGGRRGGQDEAAD